MSLFKFLRHARYWREVDHFAEDLGPADPDCFTMVLAHEFFDALPINIFEVRDAVDVDFLTCSSHALFFDLGPQ